jgi:hypothetical protein
MLKEYTPTIYPVINKSIAEDRGTESYVCWPNRVAVVSLASNWTICTLLDYVGFIDMHHVHVSENGIWVGKYWT